MKSENAAFIPAPVGLALTEDRVVRRCNIMFADMFGPRKLAELVAKFSGMPLSPCVELHRKTMQSEHRARGH